MKISQSFSVQSVHKAYKKNVQQQQSVGKGGDRLEISTLARDIQTAKKAISELPEIREEKVNELKAQIKSGNYKPDLDALVDKIIGSL